MKKKENENSDLHDDHFIKKVNELEFDKQIDDKYTNGVIDKYKRGLKKNHWFTCSGVFSILFGVTCIVTMIIVGLIFVASIDALKTEAIYGALDFEAKKKQVVTACIVIPIIGVFAILVGLKISSYAKYTREMLMKKTGSIAFYGILQFFVGGVIFSLLTFIGYFVGRGIDYGAIYYNRIEEFQTHQKDINRADDEFEEKYNKLKEELKRKNEII